MISDDFIDSTIANLKVIGMVPRNGRLCVRKGQLCLETPDQFQAMRRWARGDSRDLTLMHVRNTINNASRITHLFSPTASDHHERPRNWTTARIINELAQCEVGLQNLKTTYSADSLMVANIGVLIERISTYREQLASQLSADSAVAVNNKSAKIINIQPQSQSQPQPQSQPQSQSQPQPQPQPQSQQHSKTGSSSSMSTSINADAAAAAAEAAEESAHPSQATASSSKSHQHNRKH